MNIINNYYKPGPATQENVKNRIIQPSQPLGKYYVEGNFVEGDAAVNENNWNGGVHSDKKEVIYQEEAFPAAPVTTHNPREVLDLVLAYGGASYRRDAADERIVRETRTGTATYKGSKTGLPGIIDSQKDVGGWPKLDKGEKKTDSDRDGMPDLRKNETRILIKNGVYKEKLVLPESKTNVTFFGEDVNNTIITYDNFSSRYNRFGEEIGTSGFFVYGDGFKAKNITFENSAGPVGQAVAVRIDGDRVMFEICKFLGFQDTLYPHGRDSRQYYKNCYIEGTTDFIFGWSTAVFEDCEIYSKEGGHYITAASTEKDSSHGFVFINCKLTGNAPEGSVYLGILKKKPGITGASLKQKQRLFCRIQFYRSRGSSQSPCGLVTPINRRTGGKIYSRKYSIR